MKHITQRQAKFLSTIYIVVWLLLLPAGVTRFEEKHYFQTIKPLSPNAVNGAFVMVLGTNASAVTDAIGQISENHILAVAITNLANRQLIMRSGGGVGTPKFEKQQAAAASEGFERR